jgi:hypothetical protein
MIRSTLTSVAGDGGVHRGESGAKSVALTLVPIPIMILQRRGSYQGRGERNRHRVLAAVPVSRPGKFWAEAHRDLLPDRPKVVQGHGRGDSTKHTDDETCGVAHLSYRFHSHS